MNDLDPSLRSEQQLSADLAAGDASAFEELVGRYAADLYDFAIRIVLDASAAASVLEDSLERAQNDAAGRTSFLSLRAWLLALVRDNALEALRQRGRADAEPDQAPTPISTDDSMFVQIEDPDSQELATWAWQAARGQRPRDYSLLDLSLRRQITPEEIAELAGLSRTGIYGVSGRLRGSFEEAFAATALFYRGREACPELQGIIAQNSELKPALRRDIARHAETCANCRVTLNALPLASDLFAMLSNVDLPPEIEAQVQDMRVSGLVLGAGAGAAAAVVAGYELEDDERTLDLDELRSAAAEQPNLLASAGGMTPADLDGEKDMESQDEDDDDIYEGDEDYVQPTVERDSASEDARRPVPLRFSRAPAPTGAAASAASSSPERIRFDRQDVYASSPGGPGGGFGEMLNSISGGRGVWFLALLLGITLIAGYVGVAVGDSLSGGGDDSSGISALPTRAGGVRALACGSGPLTVDQGSSATLSLDPKALNGYQVSGVTVQPVTPGAAPNAVVARTQGGTNVVFEALAVPTQAALNEYRLSLTLTRGNERLQSDCTVVVRSAAGVPGATATRPAVATTPGTQTAGTPAAGTPTPVRTGTVTAPPPGSTATRVP